MGLQDTGGGGQSGGQNTGGGGGANASGDVALLARLISAEARGEPYHGQVAVGAVVLNRIGHPSFPNSLSGVIYQNGAFTCIDDGQFNEPIADSAYQAARDAMNGSDPSGGAIYYFNPSTATSKWIWSRPLVITIGKHRFCM
jgi:N-acetylmuramoyl-L-alanine amidase